MKTRIFSLILALLPLHAFASDAWVIMGRAAGGQTCSVPAVTWTADALVRNFGGSRAVVRQVHDSNGGVLQDATELDLEPGQSASLLQNATPQSLFVRHLDVPADVVVDGRLELSYYVPCTGVPPAPGPGAKVALPVYTQLTPANVRKVFTGTDIGYSDNARVNVGIYNAGSVTAVATIDVRRGPCEGVRRDVTIPADTLVQFSLPMPAKCDSSLDPAGLPWAGYTTVTADQATLSYAVTLSNTSIPTATFAVAGSN